MTAEQAYEVYRKNFPEAFPPAELRPWRNILAMIRQGRYVCYGGYTDDGSVQCCAFFIRAGGVYLMDYLMTVPQSRGGGWGSRFLKELLDGPFAQAVILGEVEAPDKGPEDEIRRRRLAFYERNRFVQTCVKCCLYEVEYRIIAFHLPRELEGERLIDKLKAIYTELLGTARYTRWVRLWCEDPDK